MTAATAPSIRTIHELKKYDGPLYIANNTPFKITCRDNIGDTRVDFELEAQGHPDSVMILPKGALDVRGIQKMWLNGEVTVSTDEAMSDQIALLFNQAAQTPEQRLNNIMERGEGETLEVDTRSASSKGLAERPCLQCGSIDRETGVIERGRVIQTMQDVNEGVPPLCPNHLSLASQFTSRATLDKDGNQTWTFDRVQLSAPVRETTI